MKVEMKAFSDAQVEFLEFVRVVFQKKAIPHQYDKYLDLNSVQDDTRQWTKRDHIRSTYRATRETRLETGTLKSISINWDGSDCYVWQNVELSKPYFDENIFVADHGDRGIEEGAWVFIGSIGLGRVSWARAASVLYRFVGLSEKADRVKFVQLLKAIR